MSDELKHATIIPLIGGMTIGVSKAVGGPPDFMASYNDFRKNDTHAQKHYEDVPFYMLDIPYWNKVAAKQRPDIVSTVCPCAGLSITSSASKNHGAKSTHNQWMYDTAEFTLENMKPAVMFGENAPGLFGAKGRPVANKLHKIGKKHGYSFSMVFTDTRMHGCPQRRPRTFYFFWRAPKAPKFQKMERDEVTVTDFMREVKPGRLDYERLEYCRFPLQTDIYYMYAQHRWGQAWRSECENRTIIDQLKREGKQALMDLISWVKTHHPDHEQTGEILRHKGLLDAGRGLWDESPKVVAAYTPAIMFKNVKRIVHPLEDRFLNVRELMALMGFPPDFHLNLGNDESKYEKNLDVGMHHISQNVPVNTAQDMANYVIDVLDRKVQLSDSDFYTFDNTRGLRVIASKESLAQFDEENQDDE